MAVLAALVCIAAACAGCGVFSSGQSLSFRGYGGTAVVSIDGRTVTVGPYLNACPAKISVVARESGTRVALLLRYVTPDNPPNCGQVAVGLGSQSVRLHAPLGSRKLVDGRSGRELEWISARRVLRPKAVPELRLSQLIPAAYFSSPQRPGPAGCAQFYSRRSNRFYLFIVQSAGGFQAPLPKPGKVGWTSIRVRGHRGRAERNLITWREDGLDNYMLAGQGPQGPQLLSTQQLIAIADSSSPPP
jgi:hypothetical protein